MKSPLKNTEPIKKRKVMAKKIINRQDWSGRKGTYSYTKDTITVNGYKFKLKRGKDLAGSYIKVLSKEHNWGEVFSLYKSGGMWNSIGATVEREGKNPYDVIATVVWNTF